jgi:hypothetical protein
MSREDEIRKLQQENAKLEVSRTQSSNTVQLVIGVVIVLLGVWFLSGIFAKASTAELIPRQALPILLFLFGVVLTGSKRAVAGLGLMALSLVFLLRSAGAVSTEAFDQLWLAVIVLGGLFLVLDAQARKKR